MTPILYEKDEIDFTSQGLGALAEIYDVDVAEQRNGLFQLTANYPVTGIRYEDISAGRIILAKPNQRDEPHAFRIVNTELDVMGYSLMIEADSITYDLNHNFIKHLTVNDATGQVMMSAIQAAIVNPSIFTFYSDINHKSSTKLDYVNPMEAVMGVQGSFLQYWGGELKRENRRVAMFNRRGRDNVATFRLGKNISGLKYKVDISSLVTRIMPVKSVQENDKTTYLEGTPVSSKYINNYEQIYTIKVDFTDDTIKTVDDLNKAAEGWFVDSANTGRDKPSVTIDIDVLSLQDSVDYQDKFKNLESVALTDTVTVYVPEYGVNVTAIVNEIHFDPIQERVTKLVVGTAKQSFADSSRVQLSDLQNKVISVQEQADQIAVSANGKNSNYYGSVAPSHPQEGDFWYWKNGDLSGIKQFVNGDWADVVDSNTQQHIADSVNQAVQDAQKYSDQAIATNREQIDNQIQSINDKTAQLKNEQAALDSKAQGYANQVLADAKADVQKTSQELVASIQKETADRAAAVTALDTKAKGYADTAKEDAISVATTADGVINKKIDETASSITRTISQNKADADGKISTAQNTAMQALNEVSTKVSKTEYDTKTGQLQTDLNQTTATANQAKTDIVSIKQKNDSQDARMLSIETDANGTKTSVSALQTEQGKQSGAISTLQQRADGFDATVTKVNNMAVGGTNLFIGTSDYSDPSKENPWIFGNVTLTDDGVNGLKSANGPTQWSGPKYKVANLVKRNLVFTDKSYVISVWVKNTSDIVQRASFFGDHVNYSTVQRTWDIPANSDWIRVWASFTFYESAFQSVNGLLRFEPHNAFPSGSTFKQSGLKLEVGTLPTDYSPAPEDSSFATAKAQLTADNAALALNTYKSDADGRISQAQADIRANATAITTKVSQTDYNAKTGQIDGQISLINQTATSINQTVTSVQSQVNGLSVGGRNLFASSKAIPMRGGINGDFNVTVTLETFDNTTTMWHIVSPQGKGINVGIYLFDYAKDLLPDKASWSYSADIKGTGAVKSFGIEAGNKNPVKGTISNDWSRISQTGKLDSGTRKTIIMYFDTTDSPLDVYIKLPKLELGNMPTDWSPAPEDTDNKISTVSQTVDGISSIVSDPTTGLTTRVQTAEGNISTVQSDVSGLQSRQTQTANGLTTEISDRQNGDTNTLTQAKSFTTSSINSSESGMKSLITQTSDVILGKVGATNLFPNSEFEKDYGYRSKNGNTVLSLGTKHDVDGKFNGVVWVTSTSTGWQGYWARNIEVQGGQKYSGSVLVHYTNGGVTSGYAALDRWFVDKDGNRINGGIGGSGKGTTGEVTSPYWVKLYFEGITAPANAVALQISLLVNDKGAGQKASFTQPMVTATEKLQPYVPNNDITTQLALLKDNWSIGIADNAGKLASGVFGDINGMTLNGKTVTINANQTVITGTAFITDAMISTMSASKLTAGTIDASNINVTNINASNIVSGAISGANLNINLNTGQVVFQRGRIYNASVEATDYTKGGIDINIDKRYLASSNGSNVAMLYDGKLSLIQEGFFTGPTSVPYFEISNHGGGFNFDGAALTATEKLLLTTKGDAGGFDPHDGRYINGLIIDKKEAAILGGLTNGVVISGGQGYSDLHNIYTSAPHILVGVDKGGQSTSEIHMYSSWIRASAVEERATSNGANVYVASDGTLVRSSSSSKYKLDIEYEQQAETANKLLTLDPATWHDKFESEQLDKFHEIGVDPERAIDMSNRRYYGIIAEDLVKAGLEHLVSRNVMTGEVEGVEYSKIGVALIPIIRELRNRLNDQYVEIERLKEQLK